MVRDSSKIKIVLWSETITYGEQRMNVDEMHINRTLVIMELMDYFCKELFVAKIIF